ncbi:hypothetical protein [Desulfosarcina sp.]|uniref:hypothetical protein n=1 Tax=Desulfosarcina sp. TaxID=2027861 RepID=UPI00397059FD
MFKVMIRDNMSPVAKDRLEAFDSIEVVVDNNKETNSPEALAGIIKDFHAIAIRSGTRITDHVLANAPNLKVIGRAGAGVDNIDVEAATKRGIVVMNAPGGNTVTTAEHAISLMLSLARNIPQGTASLRVISRSMASGNAAMASARLLAISRACNGSGPCGVRIWVWPKKRGDRLGSSSPAAVTGTIRRMDATLRSVIASSR